MFIDAQRLNSLSFMDKVGFTCFPERITPIFKFFNGSQKHMIVQIVLPAAMIHMTVECIT